MFETNATYYMDFIVGQDLSSGSIPQLNMSTTQSSYPKPLSHLNPTQIGLRLPYRTADVIETNATYYMDFFVGQDLSPGLIPQLNMSTSQSLWP